MVTLKLPCTEAQYQDLVQKVQTDVDEVKSFTETDGQGTISTHDADIAFTFVEPTLTVSVTKLNSFFARRASDATVSSHITALFNKYLSK